MFSQLGGRTKTHQRTKPPSTYPNHGRWGRAPLAGQAPCTAHPGHSCMFGVTTNVTTKNRPGTNTPVSMPGVHGNLLINLLIY